MKAPVFVDTGGWLALAVRRDQYHTQAAVYYQEISKNKVPLLTSNYVLTETYTRIRYDDGHGKAIRFYQLIQQALKAGRLRLEWVTPAIHQEGWTIFQDYKDQTFSLVDCTSFVVARKAGITECFCFDEHFTTMGFIRRP